MRAGISSRVHGAIIAGFEAAVFLVPFAVAQYLPLYFYGSLLAVFGVEIAGDCECFGGGGGGRAWRQVWGAWGLAWRVWGAWGWGRLGCGKVRAVLRVL